MDKNYEFCSFPSRKVSDTVTLEDCLSIVSSSMILLALKSLIKLLLSSHLFKSSYTSDKAALP